MWETLLKVCQVAARRAVFDDVPTKDQDRVALCFAIQKGEMMKYMNASNRKKIWSSLIRAAQKEDK